MNETSSRKLKLVSWRPVERSGALVERAQAPGAHVDPHCAPTPADCNLLHVGHPAPARVPLREANVVAELWALAANIASASHAVHPLAIADGTAGFPHRLERHANYIEVNCTMDGRFLQTTCHSDEVN